MKKIFAIILLLLASVNVPAAIYIVHDIEESSVRSLSFQFSALLPENNQPIPVRRSLFLQNVSSLKGDDVILAVGVESFKQVCSVASEGAVLAVFIGQEEYLKTRPQCSVPNSAVFSGAPLDKRLALLKAVWFDRKPLAVLYSDNLLVDERKMIKQAAQYGFEFQFMKTEVDRLSVLKAINFVLEDSIVVFSLVDTELYKDGIAQDILKLLFHKQRLMVGPSFAFVRAGSLFAIYSDTEAKLNILADYIRVWQTKGVLQGAVYPDKLRVSFNPYLIKSHGVVLPSPSYLKDKFDLCSETAC